jgi:hypothetical protein
VPRTKEDVVEIWVDVSEGPYRISSFLQQTPDGLSATVAIECRNEILLAAARSIAWRTVLSSDFTEYLVLIAPDRLVTRVTSVPDALALLASVIETLRQTYVRLDDW